VTGWALSERTEHTEDETIFSTPVRWRRSLLTAVFAAYAPFALLAVFTLLFERQWGNTTTMIRLLPFAPGTLPAVFAGQTLDGLPGSDRYEIRSVCAPLASASFVLLIAALGRLGREWLVGGAVAAFFINGIVAYWLLHAIRM
jgi:hypothetical protein